MKKLYSNIVCMFVFSKSKRRKIRMNIRYKDYIKKCVKFVKSLNDEAECKIRQFFGYGCQNVMISLNDKYIFKFPLPINDKIDNAVALREKRIYDVFKKISSIDIPKMELLKFENIFVRKYKYVKDCVVLADLDKSCFEKNRLKIAKQIAMFLWVVGKTDSKELSDLKHTNKKPGFLFGWCQNDLGGNFLIDTKTGNIKYFIDWEDTQYTSFKETLYSCSNYWEKLGCRGLIVDVLSEYAKLYFTNKNVL